MQNLEAIYTKYKNERDSYNENFRLKIHRAFSWLKQAEKTEELDIQFINLWIAFNALYAKEMLAQTGDRSSFVDYLATICRLDKSQQIHQIIWKTYSGSIRVLLDNQYTFQPFWDFYNGKFSETAWKEDFEKAKKKAFGALTNKDTHGALITIFDRLYTIRNQILHGGATFNSSANREQLADACKILRDLVPTILAIMLENHSEADWGKAFYPYIQS